MVKPSAAPWEGSGTVPDARQESLAEHDDRNLDSGASDHPMVSPFDPLVMA